MQVSLNQNVYAQSVMKQNACERSVNEHSVRLLRLKKLEWQIKDKLNFSLRFEK